MEIKETGRSLDFARTCAYLGTVADRTPAHQNPGKTMYLKARAVNDKRAMRKYAVYTHRDLLTFGSMDVSHGIKGLEEQEREFMKRNRRKVQSREFIVMPADSDHISANDPDSLYHFEKYIQLFMNIHFKGNYPWFADIQPDSHLHSRVHAHIVVLNSNLHTGGAMGGSAYGIKPLRNSLAKTTDVYNQQYKDYQLSKPTQRDSQRTPTKAEKYIIQIVNSTQQNTDITSRPKFARYLAENGVLAKYRANKKHPERNGWKFKLAKSKRRYYIKGYRISQTKGGDILSAKHIAAILSSNRKLKSRQKQEIRMKHAQRVQQSEAPVPTMHRHHAYSAVSSSTVASSSNSAPAEQSATVQQSSGLDMLHRYQWQQIRSLNDVKSEKRKKKLQQRQASSSALQVERSLNARILAHSGRSQQMINSYAKSSEAGVKSAKRAYQKSLASINNMALGSSEVNVLRSYPQYQQQGAMESRNEAQRVIHIMPKFSNLDAQRYAYWGYAHVIPAKVVGYDGTVPEFAMDQDDRSLFHQMIKPIVNGFRSVKSWTYSKWRAGKRALRNYCLDRNISLLGAKTWTTTEERHGQPLDTQHHEPLINDLARRDGITHALGHLMVAHSFRRAWNGISSKFLRIIHPVISCSATSSSAYDEANTSWLSLRRCKSSKAASASMNYQNQQYTYNADFAENKKLILENDKRWYMSMVLSTPRGRASYKASQSAKAKANSKAESVATSNARKRNLQSGLDSGSEF